MSIQLLLFVTVVSTTGSGGLVGGRDRVVSSNFSPTLSLSSSAPLPPPLLSPVTQQTRSLRASAGAPPAAERGRGCGCLGRGLPATDRQQSGAGQSPAGPRRGTCQKRRSSGLGPESGSECSAAPLGARAGESLSSLLRQDWMAEGESLREKQRMYFSGSQLPPPTDEIQLLAALFSP